LSQRLVSIILLFLAALPLWPQTETGEITGSVTNREGEAVAQALVLATAARTAEKRNAAVSRNGVYNLPALLPGEYVVTVSAPGFASASATVDVTPGARVRRGFILDVNGVSHSPREHPADLSSQIDTETQTQTQLVTEADLLGLPNLTRDPYRLAELAGNLSDAGLGTRGVGLAIDGQRESSTNILLDGVDNKDEFTGSVGAPIPLESMHEFTVLTSGFTAEYGRASGGMVNAVGNSGSNALHGSGYEFNRVSALTSNSFQDNANGTHQPAFASNQFGGVVGGPILRNKLFFFENTEATIVRSDNVNYAWVPTSDLLAQSAPATQTFFQTLGQLRPGAKTIGTVSLAQLTAMNGISPCAGYACGALPADLDLFDHVAYTVPGDSGGGFPQNTWNSYNRLDYILSGRTRLFGRYGIYDEHDQPGALSSSPYANYDLSSRQLDNSVLFSVLHQWSSRWISETKVAFDRLTMQQQGLTSRGVVPTMYANPIAPLAIGSDDIAFPGYNPFSPGVGGAFGGPENIAQIYHDVSWVKGHHFLRFGGDYIYIRDNRTDAAYQTAVDSLSSDGGVGAALVGLLFGRFAQIQVAVNPQGQFPCGQAPTCSLNLPVSSPNFSRSDRFNEGALYAQDYWRLMRRVSVNLGVRWDHFGVQHNGNPNLDSNWYGPDNGFADNDLINYMVLGGLQIAPKSTVGGLYKPDWKDFAPRAGIAWDVFGDGRTSVRAGYGIAYDRNFGNVTFNVIQNLPNYAVLDVPGPVTTDNFGPLSGTGGSIALPPLGARIIDPDLKTAYARVWNASAQREISRSMVYSIEYSASRGVHLYNVSYPNQQGFRNLYFGFPCTGDGDCNVSPNPYYSENIGYRGNQGFSSYYGINNRFTVNNLFHSGVLLTANYTWSHTIDNTSSTFFEAGGQGVENRYVDQNITINNGDFDTGLLDPYQPNLDRGPAEFDIRHRVVVYGNWKVPVWSPFRRLKTLFTGWSVDPLFLARSGQPFSVFDTTAQTLDLSAPRATFTGPYPTSRNTFVAAETPDTFNIITFQPAVIAHEPNLLTPGYPWPSNMTGRDAFRAPGFWNFDLALNKDTRITEKLDLQLRAEVINFFNHANLYVIGTSANVGESNTVEACFGCTGSTYDRRQVQLAARFSF
jgi:hypothetical protein